MASFAYRVTDKGLRWDDKLAKRLQQNRDRIHDTVGHGEPIAIAGDDIPRPGATATSDGCGEQRLQTAESQP